MMFIMNALDHFSILLCVFWAINPEPAYHDPNRAFKISEIFEE